MIEILIYITMLLLLFTMFSIAWKNLLKSLCRRYLVIQKINFINNNQKEYIKYINLLIHQYLLYAKLYFNFFILSKIDTIDIL
ncbi:hypothetical protein [uncultured Brachyspira sp.]|uniref:hypothetical protein n=1 Tax=uncultured Brachyspira sp. TaxID=221953 RepID=UPI0026171D43|nr:hypothetical protein [uncultured Brachyspira sp.]